MKKILLIFLLAFVLAPVQAQDDELDLLFEQAANGDIEAQKIIGATYIQDGDYEMGVRWTLKAAKQGDAEAEYNMGF